MAWLALAAGLAAGQPAGQPTSALDLLRAASQLPLPTWKFCPGVSPEAPSPALDDSGWADAVLPHTGPPAAYAGWYRTRLTVPDRAGSVPLAGLTLTLNVLVEGSGEVFVDGAGRGAFAQQCTPIVLTDRAEPARTFLIAIRVDNPRGAPCLLDAYLAVEPLATLLVDIHDAHRVAVGRPDEAGLLLVVERALNLLNFSEPGPQNERLRESAARAREALGPAASAAGQYQATLLGQASIEPGWLWLPGPERYRDLFAGVLALMDQYPLFRFAQPAALPYWSVDMSDPALFRQLRERVRQGRWEVVGGAWTDADCMLPGGESLVRQFLYGKQYLHDRLGVDVRVAWLPESLGYSRNLPQILKKSGIDYFLTAQMAWNDTNPFPHHLFWWNSPDGSSVLSYLPYGGPGGPLRAESVINQVKGLEHETGHRDVLVLFGGAAGPGLRAEDLESLPQLKQRDVFPQVTMGQATRWFDRIPTEVRENLRVWNDELYLECDREAYTSGAALKKANRDTEVLLRQAEQWSAIASLLGRQYPADPLAEAWRLTLGNQSRAVLGVVGAAPVYLTATDAYERACELARAALNQSLQAIADNVNSRGLSSPLLVFNPHSWPCSGLVQVEPPGPGPWQVADTSGAPVPTQLTTTDAGTPLVLFLATDVPPCGYLAYQLQPGEPARARETKVRATQEVVENEFLEARVDSQTGEISSLFDKQYQRQVLILGQSGNQLQLLEEPSPAQRGAIPGRDTAYSVIRRVESISVLESGPVRAAIRVTRSSFSARGRRSRYTQDIMLAAGSRRLDIRNRIDWQEENCLLKAAFPIGIMEPQATYDTPFAAVTRATGMDTPLERARWEVPVQKWADLSNGAYGVSLLNEGKCGADIHNGIMRLTLLRGVRPTDPAADRGLHEFVYSLYPHTGDWRRGTVAQANELNAPLLCLQTASREGPLPPRHSFFAVNAGNVVLEALKQAEDGSGLVLRLVEYYGNAGAVEIIAPNRPKRVSLLNLLEEEQSALPAESPLRVPVGAYEIVTLKLEF